VSSDISASEVHSLSSICNRIAFIDSTGGGDSITAVKDDARGHSSGVKGEDRLVLEVNDRDTKVVEHHLGHADSVSNWVQNWLSQ